MIHFIDVKELPSCVFSGFATASHLIGAKCIVAFAINTVCVWLNNALVAVIGEREQLAAFDGVGDLHKGLTICVYPPRCNAERNHVAPAADTVLCFVVINFFM